MKKIKKILTCIDFSDYSPMTLEYAASLAKDKDSELIIYNVINIRDVESLDTLGTYFSNKIALEDYVNDIKKERKELIEKIIQENHIHKKSIAKIKVETGIPFEAILKTAEKEDVDIIVMGNKGRGNISRVLFGSVAEKVFRHSPVPVVSVRDKARFKRKTGNE